MGDGFASFNPTDASLGWAIVVEAGYPDTRMNDGRTDRQGRFWAGSTYDVPGSPARPTGSLYRLDQNRRCTRVEKGIAISNGLAWSPDGATLYHTDSALPFVWQWDYDVVTGDIANRRLFVDLSDLGAIADGATVDAEGCYWVALPHKGRIQRYDPGGNLIRSVSLPVDMPTCCEFGGPDLDRLFVTSATLGREQKDLADQPLAGGLFVIDVGVRGLASTPFAG
jgi:sugar lactone lactonase YvrE